MMLSDTKAKSFNLFGLQVLCKATESLAYHDLRDLAEWLPAELDRSGFVTDLQISLITKGQAVSSTLSVPRTLSPLRLIRSRFPHYDTSLFDNTYRFSYFVDTLECGHQVHVFDLELEGQKRHRCHECLDAETKKKPVRSVPSCDGEKEVA